MDISVYLSKKFCSEESSLHKVESIDDQKIYAKNKLDEIVLVDQTQYRLLPSSKTTLKQLYADGWRLASTQPLHSTWMFVFLERG